MTLLRLLIIAFVVWLLVIAVKRWLAPRRGTGPQAKPRDNTNMVRCAHCGLHIPQGEALQRDGLHFCSQGHLDQYRP